MTKRADGKTTNNKPTLTRPKISFGTMHLGAASKIKLSLSFP